MFGVTVSLFEKTPGEIEAYLDQMSPLGAGLVFSSLRVPEESPSSVKRALFTVGPRIRARGMRLVADVSPVTFETFSRDELAGAGVTSLRIDNGLSADAIACLSEGFEIVLNASTVDERQLEELARAGLEGRVVAWHNYYPRKNTGLDREHFIRRNRELHELGVRVGAFIAGDAELRGTIYEGLPTLEEHRTCSPTRAWLELVDDCGVDEVVLADFGVSPHVASQLRALNETGAVELGVRDVTDERVLDMVHRNRVDVAADVLRSREFRRKFKERVPRGRVCARPIGSVTVDNEEYGRYMGEMQVALVDLPADDRVNVVARVVDEDLCLLEHVKRSGRPFVLRDSEKC